MKPKPGKFADILPPLTTSEFDALKSDIKANGVLVPIIVDENGDILDGHHRYKCDKNAPVKVVSGLSASEKEAFTIRVNLARRNLSPNQKADILTRQKTLAKLLRSEDEKTWTQAKVAAVLGVDRSTVSKWFDTTNVNGHKGCKESKPDARVKVNTAAKDVIYERVLSGETQCQVAADFGVSQQAIAKIVKTKGDLHKRDDDKARKTAHLKRSLFEVRRGDFREVLSDVDNVSLILTDPPYPKESLYLWDDLGKWASTALAKDGILVAYSGQMYLPSVLENLGRHLEYWWCGAVVHKGSGNLTPLGFPVRKVVNAWKPIVMFYRKDGTGFDRTFNDIVTGVGPKKDDHNWQQPIEEAKVLVERFSKTGELVVDPFAGSGGFCKAAHDLGRIAVGAEILSDE
jgi:transcriptional regulator with XRE-family HTH domain